MKNGKFRKTYGNSYLRLYQMVFQSDDESPSLFLSEIERISKIFCLNSFDFIPLDPSKDKKNYNNIRNFSTLKVDQFLSKLNENKKIKFFREINKSRKELSLGKEWNPTIIRVALSGVFIPPPFSVYYFENEDEKIISFEINKNTTKFDLDLAWESTRDLRRKIFKRERAFYATKKTVDNFNLDTSAKIIKFLKKEEGCEITDMELITELLPDPNEISESSDRKAVNKLRVVRSRQKRKK